MDIPGRGRLQCARVDDGGVRPHMDDSDGMGVQRGAAPKNLGKPHRMYEDAPNFTHLEQSHCRFGRRILTFHNRISSSSSHLFRNPLYEVHVLGLVNNQTQEKSDSAVCCNKLEPQS